MKVKWKKTLSSIRNLPGGGPQGCPLGQQSYISQSNENASFVPEDDCYKWIDDLSILEIVNLVTIGISSYNFKHHVASDVAIDQYFLSSENIKSQFYMDQICSWTSENEMKLNENK